MEIEENGSVGNVSTLERRVDPRSPMSAGRLNASTMSMRAKAKRKRLANAQHNSNFRAGYVPVDEDVLQRSGIRGRKRYFLYCFLVFLLCVVLLNALVTAWLIYILGIMHNGMMSIEMIDIGSQHFLRVLTEANIVDVSFTDKGFLGSRQNKNLSFVTSESYIKFEESFGAAVSLEKDTLTFSADDITVYSSAMDKNTSISMESIMELAANLNVANITASKVESLPDFRDLSLESTINEVRLEGFEDVNFFSEKAIHLGQKEIVLEAQNNIIFDGQSGVFVDPNLMKISSARRQDPSIETYKLCVCETGRIFKVPVMKDKDASCDVGPSLHLLCAA